MVTSRVPVARIHTCRLVIPPPREPEPHVDLRSLVVVGLPLVCVFFALLIPALHR